MDLPDDLLPLESAFVAALERAEAAASPLPEAVSRQAWDAALQSRILDITARRLRAEGHGHYTIASSGHESNAVVAAALLPTDPALLHYRSGGFFMARTHQAGVDDAAGDVLRGMFARSTEPIAGGRHKVWGSHAAAVIPQTSTIASHLPRAVGLAVSLGHRSAQTFSDIPAGSIAVASIGDASFNHASAQTALNAAAHYSYRGHRVPLLLVVEDNGLGISVPTPDGWIATALAGLPQWKIASADGEDPAAVFTRTQELAEAARRGTPALLHLRTVRYLAHAGSDVESAYRSPAAIRDDYDRDPLVALAAQRIHHSHEASDLVADYLELRESLYARGLDIANEARLQSRAQVIEGLTPPPATREAPMQPGDEPATLAESINAGLSHVLSTRDQSLVFGEDVANKGGVYGVTRRLQKTHGRDRVFDTLLDETTILGLAAGAALAGRLPMPEIQYLAYLHNAEDQLRGEIATLSWFSQRQYTNGMVIRIAALGYQKGFGGHFHNDNSVAVLRDIPGIVIGVPSHPADAASMVATMADIADAGGVCVSLEPIALYHRRHLIENTGADDLWLAPPASEPCAVGTVRTHRQGSDITLITYGNGVALSLEAAAALAADGIEATVIDMRWLAPLPIEDIIEAADRTGRVLIVDEGRATGGVAEGVVAALIDRQWPGPIARVTSADSLIPLGDAANLVLLSVSEVITAATDVCARSANAPSSP